MDILLYERVLIIWLTSHTMKRIGCDLYVATSKETTLKWHPSNNARVKTDECHDVTKENGASSNAPYNVCIEGKTRHKQDRGNE